MRFYCVIRIGGGGGLQVGKNVGGMSVCHPFASVFLVSLQDLVHTYLFLNCFTSFTGHFVAPFAAHAFCNHMGFPDFEEILTYKDPQRMLLMSLFVFGLIAWCILLTPLTNPAWYSNHLFWKNH
jgi:prenyl protein peptidase